MSVKYKRISSTPESKNIVLSAILALGVLSCGGSSKTEARKAPAIQETRKRVEGKTAKPVLLPFGYGKPRDIDVMRFYPAPEANKKTLDTPRGATGKPPDERLFRETG